METNRLVRNKKVELYASAILENVEKTGGKEGLIEARAQIRWIIRYMRSRPVFVNAADDESYTPEQRNQLIRGVFTEMNPVVVDVLALMAERLDIRLLARVYRAFDTLLAERHSIVAVDVQTAVPLDDGLRELIRAKVKDELGMDAILNERVNENMLGGIIMSVQGRRIDASVRAQLDQARLVLKKNDMEVKASD